MAVGKVYNVPNAYTGLGSGSSCVQVMGDRNGYPLFALKKVPLAKQSLCFQEVDCPDASGRVRFRTMQLVPHLPISHFPPHLPPGMRQRRRVSVSNLLKVQHSGIMVTSPLTPNFRPISPDKSQISLFCGDWELLSCWGRHSLCPPD